MDLAQDPGVWAGDKMLRKARPRSKTPSSNDHILLSVRRAILTVRSRLNRQGEASFIPTAAGGVKDKLLTAGDPLLVMCEKNAAMGTKAFFCFLVTNSDYGSYWRWSLARS